MPFQIPSDRRPNVKVDSRYEDMPARPHQPGYVTQASFRLGWDHVAEKIVCHYNIVRTKRLYYIRLPYIAHTPSDALLDPGLYRRSPTTVFKEVVSFHIGHALKNMRVRGF